MQLLFIKKKSILFVLLLPFIMVAQTTEVHYLETRNIENQLKQIDNPMIKEMLIKKIGQPVLFKLVYSNGVSSYAQHSEAENTPDENITVVSGNSESNKIYKKSNTKEFIKKTNLLGKDITIADQLIDFRWTIKDETVIIGNYSCKIAEGLYNEKKITAYFTTQISISEGPDLFQGLPGLIIKLDTTDKTYLVKNIVTKKDNTEINIPSPEGAMSISEYEKIKKEQIDKLKRNYGNNAKVIKS